LNEGRDDSLQTCALCKQKKKLKASHIVPRFVGKWLKSTSATGFLRGVIEPNKRLQDLPKMPLLCEDCEEKLSRLETYFANRIFFPFLKNKNHSFKYDTRLLEFAASLSWRALLVSYDEFRQDRPHLCVHVDKAEETWRQYLSGESQDLGPYEHHLFFFDYVKGGNNLPHGFQWYTLRASDATLVSNEKRVFAYSKLPWMTFVSSIHPIHLDGWYGTKIEQVGEVSSPQRIEDEVFGGFLVNRAKMSSVKISDVQHGKILKSLGRKPQTYLKSQSLQVSLAEAERARRTRKEKFPALVTELVEIIERALEDPSLEQEEKQFRKLGQSMIADAISRLPKNQALNLNLMIESTIRKSSILLEETKCTFETSELIISFMVNQYCSKDQQRKKVMDEAKRLFEKRKPDDKRYIVVFSWNPFELDFPYETGYFIS
jgi:hypothetical protein